MSITHTVFFHFKADTKPEDVKATVEGMFALKTKCVHAESQTPYIKSFKGGKDISIEGLQNGITHGFVVEFASVKDRDYYVKDDPAHAAFVKELLPLLEKAVVVDFEDGVY